VRGITSSDSANSAIASCSREPSVIAKFSRYTLSAVSTAPPPGTAMPDSSVRFTTQSESWIERSISSRR